PRSVDLTPEALEALQRLYTERTVPMSGPDLVWPEWRDKGPQAISARFKTVARRAGLESLRFHDLRHAFCSRLAQAGVPLATIAVLAGHRSLQTTQRYACHVPGGATKAAVAAMVQNEKASPKKHGAAG
ncbi:MAG: site-specific integrase, partial [Planctomycetota bacterium]